MRSTSCLQMAKPRPVPPYLRVVELSPWMNGWNSRACSSLEMPTPVSRTAMRTATPEAPFSSVEAVMMTSPLSVNLIALLVKFARICARRVGSPRRRVESVGATRQASSMPLRRALSANTCVTLSTVSRRSKSTSSTCSFPASILEKSRMSLMIASSVSAAVSAVPTKRSCFFSSGVLRSRRSMPMTPFMGVRISWLMLARNCALAAAAAWASRVLTSRSCVRSSTSSSRCRR